MKQSSYAKSHMAVEEKCESMFVRFLGATEDQIRWGLNDDPNKVLNIGEVYEVEAKQVHMWHTKIKLRGYDGWFNLASFEIIKEGET